MDKYLTFDLLLVRLLSYFMVYPLTFGKIQLCQAMQSVSAFNIVQKWIKTKSVHLQWLDEGKMCPPLALSKFFFVCVFLLETDLL